MGYKFSYPRHVKRAIDLISFIGNKLNLIVWVCDSREPYLTSRYLSDFIERVKYRGKLTIFVNKMDLVDDFDYRGFRKYLRDTIKKEFAVLYGSYKNCKQLYNHLEELAEKELFVNCLFVGLPNVGKSSVINCLVNRKKTEVSSLPGTTRNIKWIALKYNIKILDSPGVVLPTELNQEELKKLLELNIINHSFISLPGNKFRI
ncbi:MAG: GTPase [Candidatus Calescibacterium sp.]|nr:50S ribosome-binding GTPase [Candidatus Calescibacterium sp.]MCX7971656.1 50S ribosome-binding GTPase [bacterium]MDW8195262.1 GTPase [Candidatus Calescibacterium sp.]